MLENVRHIKFKEQGIIFKTQKKNNNNNKKNKQTNVY